METAPNLLLLAAMLPLASALILLMLGHKLGWASAYIATASIVAALGLSVATLVIWVARPQFNQPHFAEAITYRWLPVSDPPHVTVPQGFNPLETFLARNPPSQGLSIGVLVDSLTITMFLAVSLIATLVHLFSIASLGSDERYPRFLAYLGLLCFSTYGLALSNNLLQMMAFLQLLALSTYLLIGFARQRRAPTKAATGSLLIHFIGAAFILVGTGTLVAQTSIGITGLTFYSSGTDLVGTPVLERQVLLATSGSDILSYTAGPALGGINWLTWAGICIFIGVMVTSAQFPLHVWLVDAAEGPSTALAMFGSVTSVAAGAFIVARLYGILTLDARLFIATAGCVSIAAGALLALVQTNLKRILACSTVSSIGFVMLFFGCGAYVAALFVLFTHAFAKACLFLAGGSVLHSCRGENQLRRMGGLWKRLPITAGTFMVCMLSICGAPWLSGFFSQQMGMSIVQQYANALPGRYGLLLWWIPSIAIGVTAVYMWRCWWLVFGGKSRDPELQDSAHENPLMTLVLILLTGLTVSASYLDIDHIVAKSAPASFMVVSAPHPDPLAALGKPMGWAVLFAALGVMIAYLPALNLADRFRRLPVINLIYLWLREEMFLNHLYQGIVVRIIILLARLAALVDRYLIEGLLYLAVRGLRILAAAANELDTRILDAPPRAILAAISFVTRRRALSPTSGETP
jgi:NADH:ubiquinone oxidoreductase subunit 5 (subunit L)/multisubunit Na+/H+ antiporter MnhA subunit